MPQFGRASIEKLSTCHPDLQKLFNEVIKHYDCVILDGYRSNEEQQKFFKQGKSKLQAGASKHNQNPSLAADVVPYPIDWKSKEGFYHFAGFVLGIAKSMGIGIRWGGDWNGNNDLKDQTFYDLPHFELTQE